MLLERALETDLSIFGRRLHLNLAFDVVLRVTDLQSDEQEMDINKIDVGLQLLVCNYKTIRDLSITQKQTILNTIFDKFIDMHLKPWTGDGKRTTDFQQDAIYIYSAFMMDYGIDLYREQGRLDWRKFIALFLGLSAKTKIREIQAIRASKVPAPTKYNADEIRALREQKQYYALELTKEEAQNNVQQGLARLFGALVTKATKRSDK
jgi:hypothetical protein